MSVTWKIHFALEKQQQKKCQSSFIVHRTEERASDFLKIFSKKRNYSKHKLPIFY